MSKITHFLKLIFSKNKTLTLALVASLLVHIIFLSKFVLTLPNLNEGWQAIEIRLVNVQTMQKATSKPIENTSQKLLVVPVPAKPESEVSAANIIGFQTDKPELPDTLADIATKQEIIQPAEQTADETVAESSLLEIRVTDATNETSEINESTETANIAKKPVEQAYKYVETEFEVRRGNDTSAVGMARIVFNLDKNGTYILTSQTQAKGLASLFFDTLTQKSEGIVTDKGLIPSYYSYQYGIDTKKSQSARFAWSEGKLLMHSAKGDKTEDLSAGTQDFLSFMYQFMFAPPLENTEITMTNGKKLGTYTYSFQGEDKITSKLGEIDTIHLLKNGDEDEKIELWLGIDYQYLPVKIRKTEKDGSFIDQTVSSIYTALP